MDEAQARHACYQLVREASTEAVKLRLSHWPQYNVVVFGREDLTTRHLRFKLFLLGHEPYDDERFWRRLYSRLNYARQHGQDAYDTVMMTEGRSGPSVDSLHW